MRSARKNGVVSEDGNSRLSPRAKGAAWVWSLACMAVLLLAQGTCTAATLTLPVDPVGTWLAVDASDSKHAPTRFDLSQAGIKAGDQLTLTQQGAFYYGYPGLATSTNIMAVFVDGNGSFLFPDPKLPVNFEVSLPSYTYQIATDIPQDFSVFSGGVAVIVPKGAVALLFGPDDAHYADNVSIGLQVKIDYGGSANIAILGLKEIKPGVSLPLVAQVTDVNNQPIQGATVRLQLAAVANSGGHLHGPDSDPDRQGTLSSTAADITAQVVTDASGSYQFTFDPHAVAGTYTLTASCTDRACTQVGSTTLDVKIPNLVSLPSSSLYALIGGGVQSHPDHPDNHYLTAPALLRATLLAALYKLSYPLSPVLQYNDASLMWGGQFDLDDDWIAPHSEHRLGVVIDVRANGDRTSIPASNYMGFARLVWALGGWVHPENIGGPNGHMHVRLLGEPG